MAFLTAADARLQRDQRVATADGRRVAWEDQEGTDELRSLISEVRDRLADTSLDPVRESLAALVGASGDLDRELFAVEQDRKPSTKVPWPSEDERTAMGHASGAAMDRAAELLANNLTVRHGVGPDHRGTRSGPPGRGGGVG